MSNKGWELHINHHLEHPGNVLEENSFLFWMKWHKEQHQTWPDYIKCSDHGHGESFK
jgi:hypothetical protein